MIFDGEFGGQPRRFSDLATLRGILDKYRITRAIVSADVCRKPGIDFVNESIFEAAAQDERIVPAPVVVPNSGLEVGDENAFVEDLVRRGARVVCFYPETLGTSLDGRVVGGLFSAIEKQRLPVALFETEWLEAADTANRHPDIPFILHRPNYRNRQYLPLLKGTPNLYVSLAPNFVPYRGLDVLVRECGVEKILFASGFPQNEPGAAIGYLMYSGLDNEAVGEIAHGNLERLVDAVETGADDSAHTTAGREEPPGECGQDLCASVWGRQPVPLPGIVDMHTHYSKWIQFPIWGGYADDLVEEMDRVGIEKAVLAPQTSMTPSLVCGNDGILEAMRKYPDRLLGYASCYPAHKDTGLKEIQRCMDEGMVGIKMHTSSGIPYTSDDYTPVWQYANEKKLPVLLHTWGDLDEMDSIFETYTDAPILLGHAGSVNPKMYVEYAQRYSNLWLELCFSRAPYGLVEYLVREVGADRILYGSDAPWMAFGHQICRVLFADIPEESKKKILVENPKRVLP